MSAVLRFDPNRPKAKPRKLAATPDVERLCTKLNKLAVEPLALETVELLIDKFIQAALPRASRR